MRNLVLIFLTASMSLFSETLFEVKDALNNKVLDVSTDGLRILNQGDTVMVISSQAVRVNLDNSKDKALSRTFSVSTTSSKKGLNNVLEVGTASTIMREGTDGDEYTHFSPDNIFIGLNAGTSTLTTSIDNVFLGNNSGVNNYQGDNNIFIGAEAGYFNYGDGTWLDGDYNIFMGYRSGYRNNSGGCNIFIGDEAGRENLTGSHNIYIGTETGRDATSGNANTCVGSDAFIGGSGSQNVYLGWLAGSYATGSSNIFIGQQAGDNETVSNRLFIDNSGTAAPLIYGEFDNDLLRVNGSFNVTGAASLNSTLAVSGNTTVNGKIGSGTAPSYQVHSVDSSTSNDAPAVYGIHNVTDYYGVGVRGDGGYRGVVGSATAASGVICGIYGIASGTGGEKRGVYGTASGGTTNWAGYFDGDVNVTGTVVKSKDEIFIDHPYDPEKKYLVLSGVSSNEMKNIYDGIVVLDDNGNAEVVLPEWFEAVNKEFRYQLTAIGRSCPELFLAKEISDNSFAISGGHPKMKVSWQVTGVRKDDYALKNPIVNERLKTEQNVDKK